MTYVIGSPCIDVVDRSCVDECTVEAIYYEDDLPPELHSYLESNANFFDTVLPGREAPLGSPGGAEKVGHLGSDTTLVAEFPAQ